MLPFFSRYPGNQPNYGCKLKLFSSLSEGRLKVSDYEKVPHLTTLIQTLNNDSLFGMKYF